MATDLIWPLSESTWGSEEIAAAVAILSSERVTMGTRVKEFEREFASYLGVKHAVMVNSGSSANLLAVAALTHKAINPLRRGDAAIVPALAWATTYTPLAQHGIRLKVVDINPETLNADLATITTAITPRVRLIIAVSILGNPCAALPQLRALCDARGILLLEDNCESLGATLPANQIRGINFRQQAWPTGTFGHIGTFSFFFSHHISTGEGGMLVTDDRELADLARCLRAHGWVRDLAPDSPLFERWGRGDTDFAEAYRFLLPGYNLRPTELAAAVGLIQLRKLPAMIEARRANALRFQRAFAEDDRFILQRETGRSSWFGFTMILGEKYRTLENREQAFAAMRSTGIEFRPITGGNFGEHPVEQHYNWIGSTTNPHTSTVHNFGWFVGNHARDLTKEIAVLKHAFDGIIK